jgi:hypothetical protein
MALMYILGNGGNWKKVEGWFLRCSSRLRAIRLPELQASVYEGSECNFAAQTQRTFKEFGNSKYRHKLRISSA